MGHLCNLPDQFLIYCLMEYLASLYLGFHGFRGIHALRIVEVVDNLIACAEESLNPLVRAGVGEDEPRQSGELLPCHGKKLCGVIAIPILAPVDVNPEDTRMLPQVGQDVNEAFDGLTLVVREQVVAGVEDADGGNDSRECRLNRKRLILIPVIGRSPVPGPLLVQGAVGSWNAIQREFPVLNLDEGRQLAGTQQLRCNIPVQEVDDFTKRKTGSVVAGTVFGERYGGIEQLAFGQGCKRECGLAGCSHCRMI